MQSQVQEFSRELSGNRSIRGGDMGGSHLTAVDRWLTELGVGWVLYIAADYYPTRDDVDIWIWIRALTAIMETIRDTTSFFPYHGDGFVAMPGISEEEEGEELSPESGKHAARLDPNITVCTFCPRNHVENACSC
jgi:hypothetical protein